MQASILSFFGKPAAGAAKAPPAKRQRAIRNVETQSAAPSHKPDSAAVIEPHTDLSEGIDEQSAELAVPVQAEHQTVEALLTTEDASDLDSADSADDSS